MAGVAVDILVNGADISQEPPIGYLSADAYSENKSGDRGYTGCGFVRTGVTGLT